jgi:hypothetical protein
MSDFNNGLTVTGTLSSSNYAAVNTAGNGYAFWSSTPINYGILMSPATDTTYGGRISSEGTSDYNMYFTMGGATNRGFVFRTSYASVIFSINPDMVRSAVGMTLPTTENLAYGFWTTTTTYSIAMGVSAANYQYGPVTDYSIKMNMGGGAGRGFVWGQYGVKPIAALNSTTGDMTIAGVFSAAAKNFLIDHPTKDGMKLRHGSLEGPENGVYVRGRLKGNTITLPDYWSTLIDPNSITVQLTPVGSHQKLYVKEVDGTKIIVASENLFGSIDCFYTVNATRADIAKLVVEE